MTSQITKDFKVKSRLRALADGGSANPNMLGSGAAARAGGFLAGRGRQIDAAVDAAGAPAPTPAPAPAPSAEAPKKTGLRAMLGLADGGALRPEDLTGGTASSIFTPAEMDNFNAMSGRANSAANAEATQAISMGQSEAAQAAMQAQKMPIW